MSWQRLQGEFFHSDDVPDNFGVEVAEVLGSGFLGVLRLAGREGEAEVQIKMLAEDVLYVESVKRSPGVQIKVGGVAWNRDGVVGKAMDSYLRGNIGVLMTNEAGAAEVVAWLGTVMGVGDRLQIS